MSFRSWKPHVSVSSRRTQSLRELARMRSKGKPTEPVFIEGRTIAKSFWGKAWCENLERYSDYSNRLPRGRSYARNGAVLDLQIVSGKATALVMGSSLYKVTIAIAPVTARRWKAIVKECAGGIDSLVELLQGRLAESVMERVCRPGDGLFPAPSEIKMSCSCLDWAGVCKHVAAVLYGIGARLDHKPELLFVLRAVDERDLISGIDLVAAGRPAAMGRVLVEDDMAALFNLEMAASSTSRAAVVVKAKERSAPRNSSKASKAKSSTSVSGKRPPSKTAKAKSLKPAISRKPQAKRARSKKAAGGSKKTAPKSPF